MATPPPPGAVHTQPDARRHDWRRVALGTALAFAIPLLLVSLAGTLVREFSDAIGSNAVDAHVLDWMIDRRSDGLTQLMRVVTSLGGTLVLVPLTVVGVALLSSLRRLWLAGYLATVVIGASLLSSTAKAIVGRPRPPVDVRLTGVRGAAFPSGHATQAAATYIAVAIIVGVMVTSPALRRVLGLVCATIVIAVGITRMYLGVHWCSDVIAGWLAGAAWALGAAAAFRPLASLGVTTRGHRTDRARRTRARRARSGGRAHESGRRHPGRCRR
jgi:undecaprenyl-diphosphatase